MHSVELSGFQPDGMDLVQNYCILIRAHLGGLGVPIFQAKNDPLKMFPKSTEIYCKKWQIQP